LSRKINPFWEDEECKIIILDNRDSFVYNIAHRCFEAGFKTRVIRSDKIRLAELVELKPEALIISPGPGHPKDAGCSVDAVDFFSGKIPILGICLGHQAIAHAFGVAVVRGNLPRHGKTSQIEKTHDRLFEGVEELEVGRYHSLIVSRPLTGALEEIATSKDDGFVMGIRVRDVPTWGVQFHPESVLTKEGVLIFRNFFAQIQEFRSDSIVVGGAP